MEKRSLSELKVSNPYLRLGTDVSELEASIRTVGLIAPLVITQDNTLLAGGRRYQALLNLGVTEAPVIIVDKGELEQELISIDENLVRKDLNKQEIEGHLRRAKELYQNLNPEEAPEEAELPAQKFLHSVSEKTGLSPKQIHQAISRDEKASNSVKEARKKGELSISQTNEIIKLEKEDQDMAIEQLKHRPVREIRKVVKLARTQGIDRALKESPERPHAREYEQIEQALKKVRRQLSQLQMEGIEFDDLPSTLKELLMSLRPVSSDKMDFNGPSTPDHQERVTTH